MLLTTLQVAAKLGISRDRVFGLVKRGELKTANERNPTHKKFYRLFDSAVVSEYQRTQRAERSLVERSAAPPLPLSGMNGSGSSQPAGIASRLDRIERKIDRLLAVWE